jgi:hypothetical protein
MFLFVIFTSICFIFYRSIPLATIRWRGAYVQSCLYLPRQVLWRVFIYRCYDVFPVRNLCFCVCVMLQIMNLWNVSTAVAVRCNVCLYVRVRTIVLHTFMLSCVVLSFHGNISLCGDVQFITRIFCVALKCLDFHYRDDCSVITVFLSCLVLYTSIHRRPVDSFSV